MRVSTYAELFDRFLQERITEGGDISEVITAVLAYEKRDDGRRFLLFQDWLHDSEFTCGRCGKTFWSTMDGVREDDHVLCARCQRKSFV